MKAFLGHAVRDDLVEHVVASPMPAHNYLRPNDHHHLEDRWTTSIQQDEEQPIRVIELNPAAHLSLQYHQLATKRSVL